MKMDGERNGKEGDEEDEDKDENGKVTWRSRVGSRISMILCVKLPNGTSIVKRLQLNTQA